MTENKIDAERIAALLDGRLDERQRAEVLERIAASDENYEVFVDALAVTRELEAADEVEGVTPLLPVGRRPWWHRPAGRWIALAAAVAAVALVPAVWTLVREPGPGDPGQFAMLLATEGAGLPGGWNRSPWSRTRGPGDPLTTQARAVRLGVRITDLEMAVRGRDARAAEVATEIEALLDGVPAAGPAAFTYRELARRSGEPAEQLEPLLDQGREAVVRLVGEEGEEMVALGAWAEAARIAAVRRDAGFFRARESRAALGSAGRLPELPGPARAALGRIEAAARAEGAPDWVVLERELEALLWTMGS